MHRAGVHEQLEDFEASVADFQKALELDENNKAV